ncbi:hypothetical protein AGMMS49982_22420 [Bacteroidia bacterium]|nr:hypothetical protein AGMMS49982_22420 [Bacteroidia bacterium]
MTIRNHTTKFRIELIHKSSSHINHVSELYVEHTTSNTSPMRRLDEHIKKSLLKEGVDVDIQKRLVWINPNHEDRVDTSITNNPTVYKVKGHDVISIFNRKYFGKGRGDGNPLVCALKGIEGWKFANPQKDLLYLIRNALQISQKIDASYDVVITVPSSNEMNNRIMGYVKQIIPHIDVIDRYFEKTSMEEFDEYFNWNLLVKDCGGNEDEAMRIWGIINARLERSKCKYISSKHIDKRYVKYIEFVGVTTNYDILRDMVPRIDGKSVLILDDTMSSGRTISQCADAILETFNPKKVTIITVLSTLKSK